jgi:murein DD-endopeptidase MepM/ murein hydrolase activator NlpD
LPWFVAGFGLPLFGVAIVISGTSDPADAGVPVDTESAVNVPAVVENSTMDTAGGLSASETLPVEEPGTADSNSTLPADGTDTMDASSVANFTAPTAQPVLHPPLALPPEFDTLALTISRGDTLDQLFRRNGLNIGDLAMMVKLPDASPHLKKLIPGDELIIEHDEGRLVSLYRELDLTNALRITRNEDGFVVNMVDRPIEVRRKHAYGRIETSLFESAMEAGLHDRTVMNLAGIFAWDVDFVLDIRMGDDYYILYEEIYQDGKYVRDGEVVAAEFNNNGRTIQAIRYVNKDGRSDYFTPEGQSIRKAFLRAPVDFRVSSSFNPSRRHPVLKTVRPHRGTDYAAPLGTPIKAAGDGKVIFRGVKSGYGNVVILQHGGNITTLYAHMSKFVSRVKSGTRVRQGQTIGYVGKTGLVTGVHLHYEYRLNGVHRNSRTVKLPQADPIPEEYREDFLASAEPILHELLQYKRTRVAALTLD